VHQNQTLGIVVSILAVVPIVIFVWNIFRARDDRKTTPAAPQVEAGDWKTCDSKPVSNVLVTVGAGGVTLTGQTTADGTATMDVGPISSASGDPKSADVQVQLRGRSSGTSLDLTSSPAYAAWRQGHAASDAPASDAGSERPSQ
jgi:hypothetical protein